MARLVGVDLPREKRVEVALTYIFGVGRTTSKAALAETGVVAGDAGAGRGAVVDAGDDQGVAAAGDLVAVLVEGEVADDEERGGLCRDDGGASQQRPHPGAEADPLVRDLADYDRAFGLVQDTTTTAAEEVA